MKKWRLAKTEGSRKENKNGIALRTREKLARKGQERIERKRMLKNRFKRRKGRS